MNETDFRARLLELPALIQTAAVGVADWRRSLANVADALAVAETDAALGAAVDGKDAETRKLQREAALGRSDLVHNLREQARNAQWEYDRAIATRDRLEREYAVLLALERQAGAG